MGTGITELKREVMLREWSARIAECRNSGKAVKEATRQHSLPAPTQTGMLMQVNPDALPSGDGAKFGSGVTIRHGESIIFLPVGSSAEAIADLVKALNHHA